MQIYKYTNIQIYKYTNIQIYKQIYKYTNIHVYKYTNMISRKDEGIYVIRTCAAPPAAWAIKPYFSILFSFHSASLIIGPREHKISA